MRAPKRHWTRLGRTVDNHEVTFAKARRGLFPRTHMRGTRHGSRPVTSSVYQCVGWIRRRRECCTANTERIEPPRCGGEGRAIYPQSICIFVYERELPYTHTGYIVTRRLYSRGKLETQSTTSVSRVTTFDKHIDLLTRSAVAQAVHASVHI